MKKVRVGSLKYWNTVQRTSAIIAQAAKEAQAKYFPSEDERVEWQIKRVEQLKKEMNLS